MASSPTGSRRPPRAALPGATQRRRDWLLRAPPALLGLAAWRRAPAAGPATLTLSTNNTPLDRKALARLSAEAFGRLGLDVRIVSLPSERSLKAADDGEVDGEGLRIAGLEQQYPNLVPVPERFLGVAFVAFARDPAPTLRGWDDLAAHRVAFIKGWKLFEAEASGRARLVNRVDRPEQLFRMLDSGHVDLALYTLADGQALVRQLGLSGITAVAPALKHTDLFLYLHRRHAELAPRLADTLRAMKADGSYQRIMAAVAAE